MNDPYNNTATDTGSGWDDTSTVVLYIDDAPYEKPLPDADPDPYFRCMFAWDGIPIPWDIKPPAVVAGVPMFQFHPLRMLPARSGRGSYRALRRERR